MSNISLLDIKLGITNIRLALQKKFQNPAAKLDIDHIKLNSAVHNFETGKAGLPKTTNEMRIDLLLHINRNLKEFLTKFMKPKLQSIPQNNPHAFLQSITLLWSHYQRLIYCYDFIISKMKNFCSCFYKIKDNYRSLLGDEVIGMVAVMGAYQLKKFIIDYTHLVKTFSTVFCDFISEERRNKAVPRQHIKESLAFFECCYLNYQSSIEREGDKIFLTKRYNKQLPAILRSTDHSFFEEKLLAKLLQSIHFYDEFVKKKAPNLTATDQISAMKVMIEEEERRSIEYIHSEKNREQYLRTVDEILIIQDINNRIQKQDGLKKYLASYNPSNEQGQEASEYRQEIKNFWEVYKRVLNHSLNPIKKIYDQYLKEEGAVVKGKIEKWKDFIEDLIRINKKNNDILQIFGRNFQLKNILKNSITKMLSNNLLEDKTGKAVNFRGAKNLALYIDSKFKMFYKKPNEILQTDALNDIVAIFKILTEKDTFLKQHEKTTANRLVQEVDFNKEHQVFAITSLEDKFINEIRNELGFSEVKHLTQNMKDMNKSYEETKRIKPIVEKICHEFSQIMIKNSSFWPETTVYEIQNPPNILLSMRDAIREAIGKKGEIKFQFTNGVSMFKGRYKGPGDQIFQLKNIYFVILLFIDQEQKKSIKFGDLKMKMKNTSNQGYRKSKATNELQRNIIQLLHAGLIRSPNKELKDGEPDVAKVVESDQFTLNLTFNFEEEQVRQKRPPKLIKKVKIINNAQLTVLPIWLEKALKQELYEQKHQEEQYEIFKKSKIKEEVRKMLKHAHNQNKYCVFDDFMKSSAKMTQYSVNHRLMKQITENLINEGVCERVEDQKNTYRYIA